jgi:imidazole glycerol-phosphate synthase subunit HisF
VLTRRVIPVVLMRNNSVIQSRNFNQYLPVGRPEIAVKYLNDWGADEIVLLDIGASKSGDSPNFSLIEACANSSNIPLAVGGGISSIEDARRIFDSGADKLTLNSAASNELFLEISAIFGAQAIILAVDTKVVDGENLLYDYKSNTVKNISILKFLDSFNHDLFGEIIIQSADRDGSKTGYEIGLLHKVADKVKKPIIALGGYGSPTHLNSLFKNSSVSAGAIGNSVHHFEHTLVVIKSNLDKNLGIRIETDANYNDLPLDVHARLRKRSDFSLNELLYHRISQEVI